MKKEEKIEEEVVVEEEVVEEKPVEVEKEWNFEKLRYKVEMSKNVEESVDLLIVGLSDVLLELSEGLVGNKAKDKAAIALLAKKFQTAMPTLGLAVVQNTPFKK